MAGAGPQCRSRYWTIGWSDPPDVCAVWLLELDLLNTEA